MGNNDYWHQRIPVTITNNMDRDLMGEPAWLNVGIGKGEARLVGFPAEAVRVTGVDGSELTYRVIDKAGNIIERGPIPENSTIVFPVECKADTITTNFIYFDNPSAWAPGDYYPTHAGISNESIELDAGYGPAGWEFTLSEGENVIEWAKGVAHTGDKSIKVSVKAEGPTAPFCATQKYLHLMSGVKYTLDGWVKGENIIGDALIVVLFGNLDTEIFDLGTEKASAGDDTYDWKKVTLEFTVPEKSTGAQIQTIVSGTGTAWFDDITIQSEKVYNVTAEAGRPEKLNLKESGRTEKWFNDNPGWSNRISIKTVNTGEEVISGKLICADIEGVVNRLHSEINEKSKLRVTAGAEKLKYYKAGDYVLFRQDIEPGSEYTNYIYFNSEDDVVEEVMSVENINDLGQNLIKNPDFESPGLSLWKIHKGIGTIDLSSVAYKGTGSVEVAVPKGSSAGEVLLGQTLPAKPDAMYFFSAWMKCTDVIEQPDFITGLRQRSLRAQFIRGDGTSVGRVNRIAVNPERHIDNEWSHLYMLVKAPAGADSVKVQLVNGAPGTVWFDDVLFTDVVIGSTSPLAIERLGALILNELIVWQEDPIVKVFRDDLPPETPSEFAISSARNEVEPLQLVVRSPREYKGLQVKVDPPANANGDKLDQIETGIVGYTPVNYPSNYINDRETPYWKQKVPFGRYGSDGWIGMWPDPILPFAEFDLPANLSQPIWIEFTIPKNSVPGDYSGKVQLVSGVNVVKEIPFKVHVWDFELPDESNMVALYDARINTRINNMRFFDYSKTDFEIRKEIWKMMADHRITPDVITPAPTWTVKDGVVTFDFTEFDKAAEYYLDELKFKNVYSPSYFRLFGWANLPRDKFGETPYPGEFPYTGVDRGKLRPEYKKAYQSATRSYWNHMKEKGWEDNVIFYICDEPHNDPEITAQMRALCDMIHEVDPKIPIYVSTWWYRPEYDGYVDVWGVSNHGGGWGRPVPVSDLVSIKKKGGRLFFTTDGKQCTDTPYLGFERMLPYFCFKYGAEEYEFWGSNWYTFDPYQYGWHAFIRQSDRPGDLYWIRYPNGDANFIYPGKPIGIDGLVPTIRLKVAREGVEDHEYLYLLNSLITLSKKQGKDSGLAEKVLKTATDLVTIPSSEGRYSTEYLKDPYAVMTARNEVGKTIEELMKIVNPNPVLP